MTEPSTIAERVIQARGRLGWSQQTLAEKAGVRQQTVGKIETGATQRSRYLPRIANALGITLEELAPEYVNGQHDDGPPPPPAAALEKIRTDAEKREAEKNKLAIPALTSLPAQIKVYALHSDGVDLFWLNERPIGTEGRTAALADAPEAYGLYIPDARMAPVIEPGDTVLIHPDLPPVAGADCIFLQATVEGHPWKVQLGRIVSSKGEHWQVKQFNPELEFEIPRSSTEKAQRIVVIARRR